MKSPAQPITTLVQGMSITVALPIEHTSGLVTLPNEAAVIDIVEEDRSHLVFPRVGHATWADNELLIDNVEQFSLRDAETLEVRPLFSPVSTWEFNKPLYLVINQEGNEVARVVSEQLSKQIADALTYVQSFKPGPYTTISRNAPSAPTN